jgi:hypothetical protein
MIEGIGDEKRSDFLSSTQTMKMKKKITTILFLLPLLAFAQNNFIFAGGADDGHATTRTGTPTNNPIFNGGSDDGHAASRTETPTNNRIFGGGPDDGHAASRTETPTNNGIFGGGPDDGHAVTRTETLPTTASLEAGLTMAMPTSSLMAFRCAFRLFFLSIGWSLKSGQRGAKRWFNGVLFASQVSIILKLSVVKT